MVAPVLWLGQCPQGHQGLLRFAAELAGLAGVVVVAVNYDFDPIFAGFIVDDILMQEISFARGRKTPVVNRI